MIAKAMTRPPASRPFRGRRKKMAPQIRLGGVLPRRGRLLLTLAVFALFCFFLVPSSRPHMQMHMDHVESMWFFPSATRQNYRSGFAADDVLRWVDPLIGTVNGGHVFPGATLPYGMVKAGADTDSQAENAAGFVSDQSNIIGFSHLHDSGTGGNPSLGNFPLWVQPGCLEDDLNKCEFAVTTRGVSRVNGSARASPGYFAIALNNTIRAEMTASHHTALYRFSFIDASIPDIPLSPVILFDLIDLGNSRSKGGTQVWADPGNSTARIVGEGKFAPSFGSGNYRAYACVDLQGATVRRSGTFKGERPAEEPKFLDGVGSGYDIPMGSAGSWVQFESPTSSSSSPPSILARVGMSFMSVDQACANAEAEIPDFDFDATVHLAQDAWREKLAAVQIDPSGVGEDMLTTFWSGLYRTMISPQNYTGENPLWSSKEPYYDSFYCIWDSFRAQHPLLTIIDPVAQTEMVRALVDIYRHVGKLPDCRMSFSKGYSQGGSNADVVLADAYVKNLRDGIDWDTAYQAVVSDAEVEPAAWGIEGRGGLVSYHRLGYIPFDDVDKNGTGPMSRDISRLVEYAYDDFCISLMASGLGHKADADKYYKRSANWKNIWHPDQADIYREVHAGDIVLSPFKGFMQPRKLNGRFVYANPRLCSPRTAFHSCYFDTRHSTYEGSPWLYSFFVPQDMAALIEHMDGPATFADRLSYWHEEISYIGNEQAFLPVFQFHYAGRPDLSSYWAHRYIPSQFNSSINGIPGNDDCAMGAFSAFVFMGFFPVAGQDVYLLTPPFFREVRIRAAGNGESGKATTTKKNENDDKETQKGGSNSRTSRTKKSKKKGTNKYAVIRIKNFDPTYRRKYIESATLDGKPYTKNWITHAFFAEGGLLELVVTDAPTGSWGARPEDLPPSYPVGERDDIVDPGNKASWWSGGQDGEG